MSCMHEYWKSVALASLIYGGEVLMQVIKEFWRNELNFDHKKAKTFENIFYIDEVVFIMYSW